VSRQQRRAPQMWLAAPVKECRPSTTCKQATGRSIYLGPRSSTELFIARSDIFRVTGWAAMPLVMSVSMNPGWMTLHRMPQSARR
jgi:hypothetical protein